jgi:hypothetical protein
MTKIQNIILMALYDIYIYTERYIFQDFPKVRNNFFQLHIQPTY